MSDEEQDREHLLEEGRRLASERENLMAQGVDPSLIGVPIAPLPSDRGWWVIHGDAFMKAMRRAAAGEDPDLLYAEFYANSDTEEP